MKRSSDEISRNDLPVVLVIGAGFGGLATALRLQKAEQQFQIILVNKGDTFTIGGLWQFVWNHRLKLENIVFDLNKVQFENKNNNVEVKLNTTVTEWRPNEKAVTLINKNDHNETTLQYDSIVLACGVVTDPTPIPGIQNHVNICTFDSLDRQTTEAADFVASAAAKTTSSAVVFVLAIGACPFKCPVAPFELTFLLEEQAIKAGVREKCKFIITCPKDWPMPLSTKPTFDDAMKERGIEFRGNHEMESISDESVILYKNGNTIQADLIWAIYPIQAPDFVRNAIPNHIVDGSVDIQDCVTNKIPNLPNSYAIGDCCRVEMDKDLTIPKAGEFAWKMGQSVADDIAKSDSVSADRTGRCIAEIGLNQGITVENDFSAMVKGGKHQIQVVRKDDSEKLKVDWVNSYLSKIFGNDFEGLLTLDMLDGNSKKALPTNGSRETDNDTSET